MPMEDHEDFRCPFCRSYLTDLDGLWECQEGCGSWEYEEDGIIKWEQPFMPFQCVTSAQALSEVYDSDGQLIGGLSQYEILPAGSQ